MTKKLFCWVIISVFFLCGCADMGPKQGVGAIVGSMVGSQIGLGGDGITGVVLGSLIGGLVGSEIGRLLDEEDRRRLEQARQQALTSNEMVAWSNPDSGNSGRITPKRSYTTDGVDCKDAENYIMAGGKEETTSFSSCEQPDGTWGEVKAA